VTNEGARKAIRDFNVFEMKGGKLPSSNVPAKKKQNSGGKKIGPNKEVKIGAAGLCKASKDVNAQGD